MYGYWRKPDVDPTAYGQAMQQSELYDPTTSAVTRAYVGEAFRGVGTGYADIKAQESLTTEGNKLSEEDFKNTEFYKEGVQWHDGLTDKGAEVLRDFNVETKKRQQIIADSSTGQSVLGFTVGFGAGIVEPKNLAVGVAASLATGGLAEAGVIGNTMRRMYQLKKTALKARVGIGAAEGVAAGVAIEPSNRYSARTLQQDYTMADSLFNVATSTAFGAALPAASGLIKTKIDKFRGRTMDVVAAEVDIATQQFTAGQRVDVSAVEAAEVGKLVDRPVAEQVRVAEAFVRTTETPEFKTRFEGSKVVDAQGKPMMVYHGTHADFANISTENFNGGSVAGVYFTPDQNSIFLTTLDIGGQGNGANVRPTYVDIKNPASFADYERIHKSLGKESTPEKITAKMKKEGFDGYIDKEQYNEVVAFHDSQIIPAFGDKYLPDIIKQHDAVNSETIAKHNASTIDPKNDTLIDYDQIDAMDERRAITQVEGQAEAEAYLKEAEAEIQQMLDQDILNEADLAEYQAAIEELNSSDTMDALNILHTCLTRG
jgi:hypothetical protein